MMKRREGSIGLSFRSFHFAFAKVHWYFDRLKGMHSVFGIVYIYGYPECTSQLLAKDNKAMGDTRDETRGNVKMQRLILDC